MHIFLANPVFAVHIADGILTWPWHIGGFAGAALLAFLGSRRVRDEEVARIAVLTSAFFVASSVHVRIGPTSVHLLLNGLVGIVLGWRAALAIPIGLFLQAALLGHGGFTTLGINACVQIVPALVARLLFLGLEQVRWQQHGILRGFITSLSGFLWMLTALSALILFFRADNATLYHPVTLSCLAVLATGLALLERRLENSPEFPLGLLVGMITILATTGLNSLVLAYGGSESWVALAQLVFMAYLPVAVVEGVILGFTVSFLMRVKPEMLSDWKSMPESSSSEQSPVADSLTS